jgi:glycosyltransferase involved in cell wall biosynthesis
MRISVIVTCYKEGRLLFNAFNSLQQQTTKDFEIILVNDCSTDPETIEACKTLSQTPGTTVIWNKNNLGLSGSRNIAIEKMKGEVVVLLDGDDTLPPTSIEYIKSAFASAANADLIFGDYLISDEIDRHTSKKDC